LRQGDDGEPAVTPTMPRPRSWRIAASPQATTRPAGIAACLLPATGRGGPLVSGLPPAGPSAWIGRPPLPGSGSAA